jgi:HlyD family secretion protein
MRRRSYVLMLALPLVSLVALVSAALSIAKSNQESLPALTRFFGSSRDVTPQPAPPHTQSRARKPERIGAVGIIEPSSEAVRIGSAVAGLVSEVFVAANADVEQGTPLFRVDSRVAEAVLEQRHRDLAAAEARLAQAFSLVPGLRAELEVARVAIEAALAQRDDAADMVRIAGSLGEKAVMSARELTKRRNDLRAAEANLGEAQARLKRAAARLALYQKSKGGTVIALERAAVEQARAAVKLAELQLEIRTVRAPMAGVILQVNIRPGEYAEASGATEPLIIMGEVDPLHVRVEIDEVEIPRWRPGAKAVGYVRGSNSESIPLSFIRTEPQLVPKQSLSGTATERVDTRVLQIVYRVEGADRSLYPGQLIDVFLAADPEPTLIGAKTQ